MNLSLQYTDIGDSSFSPESRTDKVIFFLPLPSRLAKIQLRSSKIVPARFPVGYIHTAIVQMRTFAGL